MAHKLVYETDELHFHGRSPVVWFLMVISQAAGRLYGFSCFTFPTSKARLCGSKLNTNVFVLNNPLIKFNRNPLKKVCEQEIYI